MKLYLSILTIFILTFTALGQQKPVEPAPRKPTRKIYVQKMDDGSLIGLFVGGDADSITVQVSGKNQVIKLSEISNVVFRDGVADRIEQESGQGINSVSDTYQGRGDTPTGSLVPRKISGGVLNGKAISLVKPEYPAAARAVRAAGAVNVQVTIEEDGSVKNAAAISGHPLLREAAENAARASRFTPITLKGQPVQVTGIIVYNFVP